MCLDLITLFIDDLLLLLVYSFDEVVVMFSGFFILVRCVWCWCTLLIKSLQLFNQNSWITWDHIFDIFCAIFSVVVNLDVFFVIVSADLSRELHVLLVNRAALLGCGISLLCQFNSLICRQSFFLSKLIVWVFFWQISSVLPNASCSVEGHDRHVLFFRLWNLLILSLLIWDNFSGLDSHILFAS